MELRLTKTPHADGEFDSFSGQSGFRNAGHESQTPYIYHDDMVYINMPSRKYLIVNWECMSI